MSSRTNVIFLAASLSALGLAVLTIGSVHAAPAQVPAQATLVAPQPVQAQPVQPVQAAAQPKPQSAPMFQQGEQTLDTNVGPANAAAAAPNAAILTSNNLKTSKVRTVSDERLPKWVPVKGRLTVVDSTDLAENLGLVAKGASKKSDERISVADKLAEEGAARAAKSGDSMTQGSSWSYSKAGRVTNHRR